MIDAIEKRADVWQADLPPAHGMPDPGEGDEVGMRQFAVMIVLIIMAAN